MTNRLTRPNARVLRATAAVALACGIAGVGACSNNGPTIGEGIPFGPRAPSAPQQHPYFGATVTLAHPPPAISGGTLLVRGNGTSAIASDPDRDQLYVVDLAAQKLVATVPLTAGDEPGRLVEDGSGRVHVALRAGGAVATLDLATNRLVDRRSVCPAPRGMAYDPAHDELWVACNGGELVTLPAAGGPATRSVFLESDLRDIVLQPGHVFVSRFRQAEILDVTPEGQVVGTLQAPSVGDADPDIAWRVIAAPATNDPQTTQLAMVHQRARRSPVSIAPGGYGQSAGSCAQTSIVESAISVFTGETVASKSPPVPAAVLPVDIAASPDGSTFAIVGAGNAKTPALPAVFFVGRGSTGSVEGSGCKPAVTREAAVPGQATAVAFVSNSQVWVQTREPAALWLLGTSSSSKGSYGPYTDVVASIALSSVSREDTGHSIVHSNAGAFIACASCHAEGGEDGRAWRFQGQGGLTPFRRTQSLRGTLQGTAPYHWEGDMPDISTLAHEVFVRRMGGPVLASDQANALQSWIFAVPRPTVSPVDAASAARGSAIFNDPSVGCSGCHAGEHFTNNATVDVGTGGRFQVPSLVGVAWRAPYLHDGRAPELVDRFNPKLAGDLHGKTSQLTTPQIDDLVSYLKTL